MRQATNSSFNEGLLMDMNPLVTPQTCLTDCLNGTLITYNGNEFTLQTDMGNVKIEHAKLPVGFIPLGTKEYGGILYLALYDPINNLCEIGSIPSPDYSVNPNPCGDGMISLQSKGFIQGDKDMSFSFKNIFLKLFEFEQLELNPGDEYVLGYSINKGNTLDLFDKVKNPLYSVSMYAIDKENKQHLLEDINIEKLVDQTKEPDQFKFFNHTITSILALSVKINNIDWFESVAYEVTEGVQFQFYGKNRLNQANNDDDDLYIRGCKIDYQKQQGSRPIRTIYIGDQGSVDTFNHKYLLPNSESGLADGDIVNFEITPYDQHTYLEHLKKKLTIKMGEKYKPGSSDNVFKYKYSSDNKSMRLDFDIPTLGMVNPYVYVEFYDVWSDYSVIMPVEDINPAGLNTLFIDTINEPVVDDYIESHGGTPKNVVIDYIHSEQNNTNKIYKPFLSNNKIRKNQLLRENNLYVVKISAIDMDGKNVDNLSISDYTNVYKFLIVNSNYNTKYDQVSESNVTSDVDFNSFNLNDNVDITFDTTLSANTPEVSKSSTGSFSLKTEENGKTYYYKITNQSVTQTAEAITDNYTVSANGRINTSIKSVTNSFGIVNLQNDYSASLNKEYVEVNEENPSIKSSYNVSVSGRDLNMSLMTNRELAASISREIKNTNIVTDKVTLASQIFCHNNISNFGLYLRGNGNLDYPREIWRRTGGTESSPSGTQINNRGDGVISTSLFEALNAVKKSGAIISLKGKIGDDYIDLKEYKKGPSIGYQEPWMIALVTKNGSSVIVVNNNKQKCIDIMNDLYYPLIENVSRNVYYYTNISYDRNSITELTGSVAIDLSVNINFLQNVNQSRKTSTSVMLRDLKALLNERGVTDYNVENTNYFKLETTNLINTINLELIPLKLEEGSPMELKDRLVNSKSDLYEQHPELVNPIEITNKVRSLSGQYEAYADKFTAESINSVVNFRYTPEILVNDTVWREDQWKYMRAIDVDKKPFDEY